MFVTAGERSKENSGEEVRSRDGDLGVEGCGERGMAGLNADVADANGACKEEEEEIDTAVLGLRTGAAS